jgi:hypothetical protein
MHLRSPFHFLGQIDDLLSLLLLLTLLCLHLLLQLLDPVFFDVQRALTRVSLYLPSSLVFLGLICWCRLSISHLL